MGLYFIGVGCAVPQNSTKNKTNLVEYRYGGNDVKYFERKLPFQYSIRIFTKGCFFYDEEGGLFRNDGIQVNKFVCSENFR